MVIRYQHPMQNVRAIRRIVIIAKTCMLTLLVAGIFFSAAAAQPERTTGIAWTKTYPNCAYCEAHAITRTSDGGYLVTGTGEKDPNLHGLLLLKTDSAGNEQWRNIDNGNSCEGNAVIAMPRGNATVTGGGCNTGTDAATLTVIEDTKGTVRQVWNFETGRDATGTALLTTADDGYLLLVEGDTRAPGRNDRDLIISRIDAGETIVWTKIFSGPRNDTAKAVITAPDGGFVIAGTTMNPVSGRDEIFLLKLDAKGTEQWVRTVGTDEDESAQSIASPGDGGYIIAGTACHRGRSGDCAIHVIRIDAAGTTLWDRQYGGTGRTSATGVLASTEGGYTLAGYSDSSERGALDRDTSCISMRPAANSGTAPLAHPHSRSLPEPS